jgi:uncharacterized protein YbaP (TraB family)
MKKALLPLMLAAAFAAPAYSQTETPPAPPAETALQADADTQEKVVVPGQRPGPGLWKISKGDHVLWVFGTYGPLPEKMVWRSHQVEDILANSQEFIGPPSASPKIGVFQMARMLPHAFGAMKNPDGKTLKEVLPPDVHARWEVMKKQYLGEKADLERERPLFAAERLYSAGLARAGLTPKNEVTTQIYKMVAKSKVKQTSGHIQIEVDDPVGVLKSFKKAPMDDVACLTKTMDRLESDMEVLKVRAAAWAKGDVDEIRKLNFADRESACGNALMNNPVLREGMKADQMEARMREAWLAAAEKALANNASTMSIMSIKHLLNPKGLLATLQAKGYQVDSPE